MPHYRLTLYTPLSFDEETTALSPYTAAKTIFEADGDPEAARDAIAHVDGLNAAIVDPVERFTIETLEIGRLNPDGTHGTRVDSLIYDSADPDISIEPAPSKPRRVTAHPLFNLGGGFNPNSF